MFKRLWIWVAVLLILLLVWSFLSGDKVKRFEEGLTAIEFHSDKSSCVPNAMKESGQFFYSCSLMFTNYSGDEVSFILKVKPKDSNLRRQLGEEAVFGEVHLNSSPQIFVLSANETAAFPTVLMTNIHKRAFENAPELLKDSTVVIAEANQDR